MANEKRLIDANALSEKIGKMKNEITYNRGGYQYCNEDEKNEWDKLDGFDSLVCDASTVDAVEVVHGRWIMDKLEIGNPYDGNSTMLVDIGNCSVCGYRCEMLPIMNYCPHCGAKMDGERRMSHD